MRTAWKWLMIGLILGATGAQAAPRAALFVQNRGGTELEPQLDAFNDMVSTRLTDAGFEVIRSQDVLDRYAESRTARDGEVLRQAVEALQTAKSEGTADEPTQAASALRLAQLMNADYLVFASLVSLGENTKKVQAYGMAQEVATQNLRVALRVLEGGDGAQLYGDTIKVSDSVAQNPNITMEAGDQLNELMDRGAVELAAAVSGSIETIEAATPPPVELATVSVSASTDGASVEVDGVAVGSTPGAFQLRPGVHRMRVTKEGYATWEKSVNITDGQVLNVAMEMSGSGIERKGELEAQSRIDDIAREQSAADAQATTTIAGGVGQQASNSYIRLEGMPDSLSIGDRDGRDGNNLINVIQKEGE